MSRKLEDLHPDVMFKAMAALAVLKELGVAVVVTSTLRTEAEQVALYAQGRQSLEAVNALRAKAGLSPIFPYKGKDGQMHSDNDYTVTRADGVTYKSNHQGGRALDVVPAKADGNPEWPFDGDPRWQRIAEQFKAQGFRWGGDWPAPKTDLPHYEIPA